MSLTAEQCRAARALIDMTQQQLADESRVSLRTIAYFENGSREPVTDTLIALRHALERAGVVFIDDDDEPGVKLRRRKAPRRAR